MGERGVSDRPEHSQADPSGGGGMGQPGGLERGESPEGAGGAR